MHMITTSFSYSRRLKCVDFVHIRALWLFERHLEILKEFLDRYHVLRSYMVYQSMVYISEYLPKVDIHVTHIWGDKYINKFEGDVFIGKGIEKKFKHGRLNLCINLGT
jgi:hypothetical protein